MPTSVVPHVQTSGLRRTRTDFELVFGFFSYIVLGVIFAVAIGVFFYGRILASDLATKDAALAKAEAAIDPATVESFVQLRDRLNSSRTLLGNHVALSGFFSALETLLPSTVRFTSLHIVVDTAKTTTVEGTGVSKNFNALSAASNAFADDGRIKDVIFSKMNINKDSSVSFDFSATLDPKILAFSPSAEPVMPSVIPTATSTTVSTTTTP